MGIIPGSSSSDHTSHSSAPFSLNKLGSHVFSAQSATKHQGHGAVKAMADTSHAGIGLAGIGTGNQ